MDTSRYRFVPLAPRAGEELGTGPFRARGLAFTGVLKFAERRLEGGVEALLREIEEPWRAYFDRLFVVNGGYDASDLLRLFQAAAHAARVPLATFIRDRARDSASQDVRGVYRQLLGKSSPNLVCERLPYAFERYFPPCRSRIRKVEDTRFEGEICGLPESMSGLYACSTEGFVIGCLEEAGARDVTFEADPPRPAGELEGIELVAVDFRASWHVPAPSPGPPAEVSHAGVG